MKPEDEETGRALGVRAIAIPVTDMDKAIEFYTTVLGMKVLVEERRYNWVEVGLRDDLGRIAITEQREGGRASGGPTGVILMVDDIHAVYRRATEMGARFNLPPQREPWRGIIARIEDPDGNELTLVDREMISPWMMGA
jgi:predicted enzyme related to lactoylglutathione lyase